MGLGEGWVKETIIREHMASCLLVKIIMIPQTITTYYFHAH
jgi:hypothetical protein